MSLVKTIAKGVGWLIALPYLFSYAIFIVVLGRDRAFTLISESIAIAPGVFGVYARQAYYGCVLQHVGSDVYFGFMSLLSKPGAVIGDGVYIGRFCTLGLVELGDDVMLADGVQVLSGRHQHGAESIRHQALRDNPIKFQKVTIQEGAWLGAGCIVMADVGKRAIVGAGAVVVKPVQADAKVGGVPAKTLH